MSTKKPNLYSYSSVAAYLQDAYEYHHTLNPSFSYQWIANETSLKSRTQVRNLIRGELTPTLSQLRALSTVFGLTSDEILFLGSLQQFELVKDFPIAMELFQRLTDTIRQKGVESNPFKELEASTSVLHLTLLAMVELPGFSADPGNIAKRLKYQYSPDLIQSAFSDLIGLGYLDQSPDGSWALKTDYLKKIDSKPNYFLRLFHRECLANAQHAMENFSMNERHLVSSIFSYQSKNFARIVQKVHSFMENLMKLEGSVGDLDSVVQFNVQVIETVRQPTPLDHPSKGLGGEPKGSTAECSEGVNEINLELSTPV